MSLYDNDDIENCNEETHFIPSYDYMKKSSKCYYIVISLMYILEVFTMILGCLNDNKTNGLYNSNFIIQYWLIIFAIYNILGLIMIYQYIIKYNTNKVYFIIYDFIKLMWITVGFVMILSYNSIRNCNFIICYSLLYTIFETIWMFINFLKIKY